MLKLLVLLLVYSAGVYAACESDQIECRSNTKCTRLQYMCDGDNDCNDYSDEDSDFCGVWRNNECGKGDAQCRRYGENNCIPIREYCRASDPPCEGDLDRRLCQMLSDEKLQNLDDIILPQARLSAQDGGVAITPNLNETLLHGEDFMSVIDHSVKSEDCPPLYTKVGTECVSIFFFGNMTWGEAEKFCEVIGGHLYVPSSDKDFDTLTHHLRTQPIASDFWIGGNFYNNTVGWRWIDHTDIQLDTNHWAIIHDENCYSRDVLYDYRNGTVTANDGVCYNYYQAPYISDPIGSCVSLTYKRFYFMSDENCNAKKSPLCKQGE